jgi:hypothetical protein
MSAIPGVRGSSLSHLPLILSRFAMQKLFSVPRRHQFWRYTFHDLGSHNSHWWMYMYMSHWTIDDCFSESHIGPVCFQEVPAPQCTTWTSQHNIPLFMNHTIVLAVLIIHRITVPL